MDIFVLLKSTIGCEYISDLRYEPYCSRAKGLLRSFPLEKYSLSERNDLVCYIYAEPDFASIESIIHSKEESIRHINLFSSRKDQYSK